MEQKNYSSLEHVARALYLGRDWQTQPYLMLSAYYDRSEKGRFMCVAGYVSEVGRWLAFDTAWSAFLARPEYRVRAFHMTDFANSKGAFEHGWRGQHQKRRDFLSGLIAIIQEHAFYAVGHGVQIDTYQSVFTDRVEPSEPFSKPYAYCGLHCVKLAEQWARKEGWTLPMRSVFEQGDQGWGELFAAVNRAGHPDPIRAPKHPKTPEEQALAVTALQASDFAAYELMKFHEFVEDGKEWEDIRESCKALTKHPPTNWRIGTEADLRRSFDAQFKRNDLLGT